MDVEIFECGKKKLRIKKYLETCGRAPKYPLQFQAVLLPLFFASPPNFALPRKEVKERMIAAWICYGFQANLNSG